MKTPSIAFVKYSKTGELPKCKKADHYQYSKTNFRVINRDTKELIEWFRTKELAVEFQKDLSIKTQLIHTKKQVERWCEQLTEQFHSDKLKEWDVTCPEDAQDKIKEWERYRLRKSIAKQEDESSKRYLVMKSKKLRVQFDNSESGQDLKKKKDDINSQIREKLREIELLKSELTDVKKVQKKYQDSYVQFHLHHK